MAFNSLAFFAFLPAVFVAYHAVLEARRWGVLLLASIGFYAALGAPALLIALAVVTAMSYVVGLALARFPAGPKRSALFWAGVSLNVAILVVVKYVPPW